MTSFPETKEVRVEIHTFDKELLAHLFGAESVQPGDEIKEPGFLLRYERTFARKVIHFPQILHLCLYLSDKSSSQHAAAWLMSHLKKKQVEKLALDGVEVQFDASAIASQLSM